MTGLVVAILTAALTLSGVGANSYLSKQAQVTSKTNQTLVDRDDADFCTLRCRLKASEFATRASERQKFCEEDGFGHPFCRLSTSEFGNYENIVQEYCGKYGIEDPFGEGKTFTKCLDPVDLRHIKDKFRNDLEEAFPGIAHECYFNSARRFYHHQILCSLDPVHCSLDPDPCPLDLVHGYFIKGFADLKRVMDKGEGYWSDVNSCKQLESKQSLLGTCIGLAYEFLPCKDYLKIYAKCEQILEDAATKKNEL